MLFLLALLILGIVWVASALIDNDAASMESLYGMWIEIVFLLTQLVMSCIFKPNSFCVKLQADLIELRHINI